MDWVRSGGHLIVRTPPPGLVGESTQVPLLSDLQVVPMADATGQTDCVPMQVTGQEPHVEFCKGRRFAVGAQGAAMPGEPARRMAQRRRLCFRTLRARRRVYRRHRRPRLPHQRQAQGRAAHRADTPVAGAQLPRRHHPLVYAAQVPSLWRTMLQHSWMAWLPLLLALLAWLWARMQRFGPLLPAPATERRSLLEHIVASGEHLYRYGYAHRLHDAVRAAFLRRLRRIDPQAAALEGEPQFAAIAERFDLPSHEVRAALSAPVARDHAAFRTRIATLIRLHNTLREPRP
jgi:hypothetical protein